MFYLNIVKILNFKIKVFLQALGVRRPGLLITGENDPLEVISQLNDGFRVEPGNQGLRPIQMGKGRFLE